MSKRTIADLIIDALADHGVRQVWGVVGDALNPVTDAIRREDRIEWIGVAARGGGGLRCERAGPAHR
jgi:pyruvate dehydrogenase (quinone)